MFDRRLIINIDWILLGLTLVIAFFGLMAIYSAAGGDGENTYFKQIFWLGFGLVGLIIVISVDYTTIAKSSYFIYALAIATLVAVELSGKTVSGAQRWLSLGPLSLQPSELTKLVIIITLARYYSNSKTKQPYRIYQLLIPGLLAALPCLLIIKQPDLGTALIIVSLFLLLSFIAGINNRSLLILMLIGITLLPFGWHHLKDYQKSRILILLNPNTDTLGAGYHSLQSKIGVGSGGLLGKGFLAGTQSRLNFLPEKYTDFIFSVIGEELGFIGTTTLIILYLFLILRTFEVAIKAPDKLGTLIAAGVSGMFGLHIFFNIGMAIGLLPIVGLPLPFMSYGGSSMLTNLMGIGLLLNIRMRRFLH
ncbi:MAG: rod shape-determining protein RodA [Nitrospinae bacterium RIFCSPLOWO2_12_FULL_45_22]|nr:MAG: rod shape-determining protein RodA [Nitrospinae bacterium RIFCSPLOWO2_12_FULL_45_22]